MGEGGVKSCIVGMNADHGEEVETALYQLLCLASTQFLSSHSHPLMIRCQMAIILLNLLVGPPLFRQALIRVGEAKALLLPIKGGVAAVAQQLQLGGILIKENVGGGSTVEGALSMGLTHTHSHGHGHKMDVEDSTKANRDLDQ